MDLWFILGIVITQLTMIGKCDPCVTTSNTQGSSLFEVNKPCRFPFIGGGIQYNGCIDRGRFKNFCATEVNENGEGKRYGTCGKGCPKDTSSKGCLTITPQKGTIGWEANVPCVFPFKNPRTGEECNECIDFGIYKNFCATEVDGNGNAKNFGTCGKGCPRASLPTTTSTATPTRIQVLTRDNYKAFRSRLRKDSGQYLWDDGNIDQCGKGFDSGFTVNGQDTKTGEIPFMALLGYRIPGKEDNDGIEYHCGGSLINRRYVLTAAHCLNGYYELAEVQLGVTDLNNNDDKEKHQRIQISKNDAIVHENWDGSISDKVIREGYDIMLIRLPELAITTEVNPRYLIRPACLPFNETMVRGVQTKKNFVATWEEKFQKLDLDEVRSGEICAKQFPGLGIKGVHEKQLCARTNFTINETQCVSSGDSGAPLYSTKGSNDQSDTKYLRGIVSIGPTCGSLSPSGDGYIPGIYTQIEHYIPWILNKLKP